ncbi:FliG C-terminal domain-containing protein [Bdellovibrio sp. HCB337]|uniref:FliG C-terminal domain-containing protein n=1 Tax=Bdellovibrio sp. HCB337 TaxID=3394358 RepID=UPI0039A688A8
MGMLDRYKKKGGFSQLLTLIETSGGKKQEQFLGLISQESPAWEQELKKKMLQVDRIFTWPNDVMSEVLSRLQPLTLCVSLHGRPAEQVEKILAPLPPISKRKIMDQMAELNPNPAEKATCEMKLITEVRAIAASGYIKFEKFDADLFVEENIEERLNSADSGLSFLNKIEINYSDDSKSASKETSAASSHSSSAGSGEIDLMKRKLNQLMQENNALKQEVHTLRDKLAQIKRIA